MTSIIIRGFPASSKPFGCDGGNGFFLSIFLGAYLSVENDMKPPYLRVKPCQLINSTQRFSNVHHLCRTHSSLQTLCWNYGHCHFFQVLGVFQARNGCFMDAQQLLADCFRIGHIPCTILHGRNDLICPPANAWLLRQRLPLAQLKMVPLAGHSSSFAPALKSAILEAIDSYR